MSLVILALAAYEGDGPTRHPREGLLLDISLFAHYLATYPLSFDECQDDGSYSLSVGNSRSGCAENISEFLQSPFNLKFMQMSLSSTQHMGLNKSNQNVKLGSGDQI